MNGGKHNYWWIPLYGQNPVRAKNQRAVDGGRFGLCGSVFAQQIRQIVCADGTCCTNSSRPQHFRRPEASGARCCAPGLRFQLAPVTLALWSFHSTSKMA
ncbi:hypothetical protein KCP78_21480 [Salmonella enterica subsp. enterica]|nr:hypothetical protein KCP78_21480 [Salmonella enterica subsp. enterica]